MSKNIVPPWLVVLPVRVKLCTDELSHQPHLAKNVNQLTILCWDKRTIASDMSFCVDVIYYHIKLVRENNCFRTHIVSESTSKQRCWSCKQAEILHRENRKLVPAMSTLTSVGSSTVSFFCQLNQISLKNMFCYVLQLLNLKISDELATKHHRILLINFISLQQKHYKNYYLM